MKSRWQLHEARNRLSEVVRRASEKGPQIITLRGKDAVVVIAAAEFLNLAAKPTAGLVEFMRGSPLRGVEIDLSRDRDTGQRSPL